VTDKVQFDPVAAAASVASLRQWLAGQPNVKRVAMDMDTLGQIVVLVLTEAELIAASQTKQIPILQGGIPIGLVMGAQRDEMSTLPDSPAKTMYFGATALARWLPEELSPPRLNDLLYVPTTGGQAALRTANAIALIWEVGAIGAALAAIGAIAYWGGKREDRIATVEAEKARALVSTEGALRIGMAQLAAGKPVDPAVYDVLVAAGSKREESRSWAVPIVGTLCGVGLLGGGLAMGMKYGKAGA